MLKDLAKSMNRATWKEWLVYLVLSHTVYFTMLIYSIPRINQEAGACSCST